MNLVTASVYCACVYQQIKPYQINADDVEKFWVATES